MQHQYYLAVETEPKQIPNYREDVTFFWAIGGALLGVGLTWGIFQTTVNNLKKQVEDDSKKLEDLEKRIDLNRQATSIEIAKAQSDSANFIKDFMNQKFDTLEVKREADKNLLLEKLTALDLRLSNKDETVNFLRREMEATKREFDSARPVVDHMRQYFGSLDRRQDSKPNTYS
jgi:hypothetical protein